MSLQEPSHSAQDLYYQTLHALCKGEEISSVKTPHSIGSAWGTRERPTKELRYQTLILTHPRDRLINSPLFPLRKATARTVLGTLSDELDLKTFTFYDPKAVEFSDDGKTLPSNYGYRIRHLDQTDQIQQVISQFREDKNTRRAVIHIHDVCDVEKKYNPCVNSLHFLIRNGALECQSFWRSENGLTLLPINLFEFTMLQELIASELEIPVGHYVHTVTSLHYYLDHDSLLRTTLNSLESNEKLPTMDPMPSHSLKHVATLREYEKKVRLQTGDIGLSEFEQLPPYWQQIGIILAGL